MSMNASAMQSDQSIELVLRHDDPTFKGNAGNLLQHWVLCEVLSACQNYHERLGFIDAHAMAPFACRHPKRDTSSSLFDAVAGRLPGAQSLYERTWLRLAPNAHEYPNSASFVTAAWRGRFAMLLCESHPRTVERLERWAAVARHFPGCEGIEVAPGDWRGQLDGPLVPSSDLHYLSFDPYMFDRHGSTRNFGNMVPADLDRLAAILDRMSGSVVVQLSTYSANNDNAQAEVSEVVISRLASAELQKVALVRVNGNMMSLVFVRDVDEMVAEAAARLSARFEAWLHRFSE
jgi:hypothetical protein